MTEHQKLPIRSLADLGTQLQQRMAQQAPAPQQLPLGDDLGFIREGTVSFSARQMQIVLDRCHYERERDLDPTHINVLADLMKADRWTPKNPIDFAILRGQPILVNGYHRAHAQIAAGRTITWTVIFHEVATMEEVGILFWRYDTNIKLRTPKQLLKAAQYAETYQMRPSVAEGLYKSMAIIACDFPSHIRDMDPLITRIVDRRLELALPYIPAARLYQECVEGARHEVSKRLLRATTMAVALATLRYQPGLAPDFWRGVATNNMLGSKDPRQTLFLHLAKAGPRHGGLLGSLMGAPAMCWNAYFEGRQLSFVKVPSDWDVHIAGTPWAYVKPRNREGSE